MLGLELDYLWTHEYLVLLTLLLFLIFFSGERLYLIISHELILVNRNIET